MNLCCQEARRCSFALSATVIKLTTGNEGSTMQDPFIAQDTHLLLSGCIFDLSNE